MSKFIRAVFLQFFIFICNVSGSSPSQPNQTATLSPVFNQDDIPFTISIEKIPFSLPTGIHSGATAVWKDKWVFVAGRTNGLHGFNPGNNFPPSEQNTVIYVVDLKKEEIYSRSLYDPTSGLSQKQIDLISVTSPQSFQKGKILYISGGYGVDTTTGLFNTKSALTAINISKLIKWVKEPGEYNTPHKNIRQVSDPILQVTGGFMTAPGLDLSTLLVFGQNFTGDYSDSSNCNYTNQVRSFKIIDDGKKLHVKEKKYLKANPNYRRRDPNVVPVIHKEKLTFAALSGVFTLDSGIWTVPVIIKPSGSSLMADPADPAAFKQAMNNYACAEASLYDSSNQESYTLLLGGRSYGFFQNGVFNTDPEIPFINQVTAIKIDKHGNFTQHLMDNEYPVIASTGSNPGNTLLFGTSAMFFSNPKIPKHTTTGVFKLRSIKKPTVLGYIAGGIMSTLPNTNTMLDSTASPYIFKVVLTPKKHKKKH